MRDRMVECGGWQTDEGDEEISTQKRPRAADIQDVAKKQVIKFGDEWKGE